MRIYKDDMKNYLKLKKFHPIKATLTYIWQPNKYIEKR